ncbi:uncharacterized protein B0H18DRAFT_641901 [Fomitopsis serialis]|uniref:uncharacterized protein n=1 Tax=Fomitopsis serialis TaxID=139415 RepID=UPI0020079FA7|nr:uncharacterized protein B0H18DRAFT_641901 [Neoantrodia serialis]KAH9933339.1 hypothetical protein B0H18DRAFT_641901 [Neoantrodia serialis]
MRTLASSHAAQFMTVAAELTAEPDAPQKSRPDAGRSVDRMVRMLSHLNAGITSASALVQMHSGLRTPEHAHGTIASIRERRGVSSTHSGEVRARRLVHKMHSTTELTKGLRHPAWLAP